LRRLLVVSASATVTAVDVAARWPVMRLPPLTAASWDLVPESYCGARAPRLSVLTSDGKTHFFGCAANRSGNHVDFKLDAAGDGSGNGGIVGKTVTSIDIVQDETGTANLIHLSFTGTAAVTATPTDRKSTRLNSSHQIISYAVFC